MTAITNKEVEAAVATAWKIPGLYRKDEARFLYRLARRQGQFVELGCWMGRTTSILLQAGKVWNAGLTTVDPFVALPNGMTQATAARWRQNLTKIGLKPPRLMELPSAQAAAIYDQEVSVLFIDADHEYEGVRQDIELWTPRVKVGGVVALHDMFYPSVTGVATAVAEWWARERHDKYPCWECLGLADFTIAFRRLQ